VGRGWGKRLPLWGKSGSGGVLSNLQDKVNGNYEQGSHEQAVSPKHECQRALIVAPEEE
jgi:hypothetical protein